MASLLCYLNSPGYAADRTDRLYDRHRLLSVQFELPDRDWQELCGQNRNLVESIQSRPVKSPFRYFKADVAIDGTRIESVGIRKKGFLGSLDTKRPSLKLNLDRYVDGSSFSGTDNITLNNCKQDQSFLSQWLTYHLYRKAGVPAPRLSLARVTVNDANLGIYANVEPVKPRFLRRVFGTDAGPLFEGTLADFIPGRTERFEYKSGKNEKAGRASIERLAAILAADELDVAALRDVVHVEQFITFWAVESLTCFWDGYCNNQNNYFVFLHPEDGKLRFIPWGADVSCSKGFLSVLFKRGNTQSVHARAQLPNALYRNDEIRKQYFAELHRILDECWVESELQSETELVEKLVGEYLPDRQRPGFREAIDTVRRFIRDRRQEILDELKAGEPTIPEPSVPALAEVLGTIHASLDTNWHGTLSNEPVSIPADAIQVTYEDKEPYQFDTMSVVVGTKDKQQDPNIDRDACYVRFRGIKKDSDRPVVVELMMNRGSLRVGNRHPVSIQGSLTEGEGFSLFNPTVTHGVAGNIQITAAGTEDNAPVSGQIKLTIYSFDWGK